MDNTEKLPIPITKDDIRNLESTIQNLMHDFEKKHDVNFNEIKLIRGDAIYGSWITKVKLGLGFRTW